MPLVTPVKNSATNTFQVASLARLLQNSAGKKGFPPASLCERGVVALSVQDTKNLGLVITQPVLVTCSGALEDGLTRSTVAHAWPLARVDDGFAALDNASISSLRIPEDRITQRMRPKFSTPVKARDGTPQRQGKGSARKGSGKKKNKRNSLVSEIEELSISADNDDAWPISISPLPFGIDRPAARSVVIDSHRIFPMNSSEEYVAMIKTFLTGRVLVQGMVFSLAALGQQQDFLVSSITRSASSGFLDPVEGGPLEVTVATQIRFKGNDDNGAQSQPEPQLSCVGGLQDEIDSILEIAHEALEFDSHSDTTAVTTSDFARLQSPVNTRARGVLIHGTAGTGKTLLARAIAHECHATLEIIFGAELFGNPEDHPGFILKQHFSRARQNSPSVIVLDEIDTIAPRRDFITNPENSGFPDVSGTLLSLLDDVQPTERVFVIATSSRPNDINPSLRRPGRLDREVELPVPTAEGRYDILRRLITPTRKLGRTTISDIELQETANTAYGFVGADLASSWRLATVRAAERKADTVLLEDLSHGIQRTKPSALREIALEIPKVSWSDVGGQHEAKQRLREAIEWPLTDLGARLFRTLNVSPPRGILLYGPPGCSKTLLAKAVATEAGANFISVKGPELLSKWVGASEKAVRGMFRRARQAAPCVVFFDEIDALASSRDGTTGASAHARVVAQLLTEMDGFDSDDSFKAQSRVVVIAATNRPDLLDNALLRPGRIDIQIHVGLPDEEERLAIFRVHTRETPLASDVELEQMASDDCTGGMSGAEVAAVVREAALAAMEADVDDAREVSKAHFDVALRRIRPRTRAETMRFFAKYEQALSATSGLYKQSAKQ